MCHHTHIHPCDLGVFHGMPSARTGNTACCRPSRAFISRYTRSINPIITSSLRRRVQLLPACLSRPRGRSRLGERRIGNACSLLRPEILHFHSSLTNSFRSATPLRQCQECLVVCVSRPKTNQPGNSGQGGFAFLRAGLGKSFLTSALHIASKRKCIMPSHMSGGKHGAPRAGKHGMSWRGRFLDATSGLGGCRIHRW